MGVVIHGEVGQPGTGVSVYAHLIALFQVEQNSVAGHGILVVVLVVLVENGGHFFAVQADGQQGLLVVVGGHVEDEEIAAAQGASEATGVGIHTAANVDAGALKKRSKLLFWEKVIKAIFLILGR